MKFKLIFLGLFILVGLAVFASFGEWLNLAHFWRKKAELEGFITHNFLLSLLLYALIYIGIVAFSLPGALLMTLIGGLLFGGWRATPLIVFSATTGAACVFLVAKWTKMEISKLGETAAQFKAGFAKNAFYYLLFLRLTPIFPFLLVNIAPALLGMKLRPFILATALGIAPASAIYATLGSALRENSTLETVLGRTDILLALSGLGLLALLPLLLKGMKK